MNRRDLLAAFGAAALTPSLPAIAQPQAGRVVRIALLGVPTPSEYAPQVAAFRTGLGELGYVEGSNAVIEFRWAENNLARLPELAGELVRLRPDVIVTSGQGVAAAKQAMSTIPIVMAAAGNAVENGLIASLGRPGGNVTGSSYFFRELNAKRLQLLKEVLPRLERVGMLLIGGGTANAGLIVATAEAARSVNLRLHPVEVRGAADHAQAFKSLAREHAGALLVPDHTTFVAEARRIAEQAGRNRLPAVGFAEIAVHGGLLGYGVNFPVLWHRAASYVDRIVKGAKPADLPVEQPTRFELVINKRAAGELGIQVPQALLLRADRVI